MEARTASAAPRNWKENLFWLSPSTERHSGSALLHHFGQWYQCDRSGLDGSIRSVVKSACCPFQKGESVKFSSRRFSLISFRQFSRKAWVTVLKPKLDPETGWATSFPTETASTFPRHSWSQEELDRYFKVWASFHLSTSLTGQLQSLSPRVHCSQWRGRKTLGNFYVHS